MVKYHSYKKEVLSNEICYPISFGNGSKLRGVFFYRGIRLQSCQYRGDSRFTLGVVLYPERGKEKDPVLKPGLLLN